MMRETSMFTRMFRRLCASSCAGPVIAFSIVCGLPGAAVAQTGTTVRVSVDSSGTEATAGSRNPSLSANGRFVAFTSQATDLVAGDDNGVTDVFVHDRHTGTTERVSIDGFGAEANDESNIDIAAISGDGRVVTFESVASNLVAGDTNGVADVFVHDRQTGITERVSVDSFGGEANTFAADSSISADGRFVTFSSGATNLVAGDANGFSDVFVHDRQTRITERVSIDSSGREANGNSREARLSADGRFVSFQSTASNLVVGDTNNGQDIVVHDRQTGITERVSVDSSGAQAAVGSSLASISADGRFVAFSSQSTNLAPGDTDGTADVFVHDRQTGITERVSVDSTGAETMGGTDASISADGRFVAFETLNIGTPGEVQNVFVHDRQTGITERISVDSSGADTDGFSRTASISADGRFVTFVSIATNVVAMDTNEVGDIFVRERFDQDADGDAILDSIDTQPTIASAEFNDAALGGMTEGILAGRGDQALLSILDSPRSAPNDGVLVATGSDQGPAPAIVEACLAPSEVSVDVFSGSRVVITCGSFTAKVDKGAAGVTFTVGGQAATASLTAGSALSYDSSTNELSSPADSTQTIFVTVGGIGIPVGPGTTISVGDRTPPTITAAATAAPNAAGWYTGDVIVRFSCADAGSGIPAGACPVDQTLSDEGTAVASTAQTVTDAAGNTSAASNVVTVKIDKTPPAITAAATSAPNAAGWYVGNVIVHFNCADAGSGIPAGACPADQTLGAEGAAIASAAQTVADAAGHISAASNVVVVKIDKTAPTLSPVVSPNPVFLNGAASVTSGAVDALSGLASQSCGATATTSVGVNTVTCNAIDRAGNTGSASASYQVIYARNGFFHPVDNLPVLNQVKAGGAIPVKFSLGGNQGLSIFAAGSPVSRLIACDASAPLDDIEQTVTAGGSSLSYDPVSGQYTYIWKTEKSWANTCRQLVVKFVDGTQHSANFKLK
jgi:Tol biopolymer transport system component